MVENRLVRTLAERGDDDAMHRIVEAARHDELSDEDVAELSVALADSGARLAVDRPSADVASTGGPGSLSTLLCPLHLRVAGLAVPKLGVPGRPAGGIDILQMIPGYNATLSPSSTVAALRESGYVHLLADQRWTPLDARLFAYRQREGAQALPALVIASILGKKLAAGVVGAGLEVRVAPHGNFGVDADAARANARRYNAVANILGLLPVCLLTDATRPYQPYVGRGEALMALDDVLSGRASAWLAEHHTLCRSMAEAVCSAMNVDVPTVIEPPVLRAAHDALLEAHGTGPSRFDARVAAVRAAPRIPVHADDSGVVRYDLGLLRTLLVERQRADGGRDSPSDPAGVVLEARPGVQVAAGDVVMSVRVPGGEADLASALAGCARTDPDASGPVRSDDIGGADGTLEVV